MARVRGSIPFSSNYEASISKPMDARMLVPSYNDLLDNSNWLTSKNTPCCFNGMLVAVANTSDTSKNGLYMLFDKDNARKPNVTIETNWIKIGETSDISDLVSRIQTIETKITELSSDIESLDARVSDLEDEEKLHTYGYRSAFPVAGVAGHMYVAVDEKKTYVWFNDAYTPVGGSEYEELAVIFGGTAD